MPTSTMRADRRVHPQQVTYEFLTFDECKALASESHCDVLDRYGRIAMVKITSVKTRKTRPNELLIGWKFGMYEYGKESISKLDDLGKSDNRFFVRIVENQD